MQTTTWSRCWVILIILTFSIQVYAEQQKADGNTITLNGGTASTTTDFDPAMWATNSGIIISNGANASTTGNTAYGVEADLSGHVTLNGGLITTTGPMSSGLYATTQGLINAQGIQVITQNLGAFGVAAENSGSIFLSGITVTTSGQNAYGLFAGPGGLISGGASIYTSNTNASAVYAEGGQIDYSGGNMSTTGDSSPGFQASNGGILTGTGFSLSTSGANSYGAYAQSGASINLTGGSLQTTGIGSVGGYADGTNSSVVFSNLSLNTSNMNAYGLKAINGGTVSFSSGSLNTTGPSASALMLSNGGIINVSSISVNAQGANSYGLLVDNSSGSTASVLNLTNGSLHSNLADAMHFDNATAAVNGSGATINASNGILASAINGGVGNITGDNNSRYDGAVITDASSAVSMNLLNGSTWSGYAEKLTNLNIDGSSIWNMTANSIVSGTAINAGNIFFTPPNPNFKQLTFLGPYTGLDGTITLNTTVNGDNNSPTDLIIFSGSTAQSSGSTGLTINNVNGLGEQTDQGILIVNGANGGIVGQDSFHLTAPVVAGPYEYLLVRDHGNNLYLRNGFPAQNIPPTFEVIQPPIPEIPGGILPPGGREIPSPIARPGVPMVPLYRQEVSLATALTSNIFIYDKALLGNLHQRTGDTFYVDQTGRRLWGHYIHNKGQSENNGTIYGNGPNFDFRINTGQVGGDLYNAPSGDHHHILGIFGARGYLHSAVQAPFVTTAGRNRISGSTLGGYFTYTYQERFYLDTVLQRTQYNNIKADSGRFAPVISHGHGVSGSLEMGYRYFFTDTLSLQPQTQLTVQSLSLHQTYDNAAKVYFSNNTPIAGRIGLLGEFSKAISIFDPLSVWLRGNYWVQGNRRNYTYYLANTGYIPFLSNLAKESVEGEVGITAKLGNNISVYGTYSKMYFLRHHGHNSTFSIGLSMVK